ncbi:MAG TPA: hypothetical protein VFW40_04770 [Capsulimonadaceae bacterium]|nr:hypothetical protein [Capsulimonadaceae bacterium]
MATEIRLEAQDGYLSLSIDENGWCRCTYEAGTRLVLGSEAQSHVISRLAKAVAANLEAAGLGKTYPAFGYNAYYVLMLRERRYALYATESNGARLLLWVNAQTNPLQLAASLRLNENQRQEWFNRLVAEVECATPSEEY